MIYLPACRLRSWSHLALQSCCHPGPTPGPRHHPSFDIVALRLLVGSVIARHRRLARAEELAELLRILAIVVLGVALRMGLQLGWRPEEIYTVQML